MLSSDHHTLHYEYIHTENHTKMHSHKIKREILGDRYIQCIKRWPKFLQYVQNLIWNQLLTGSRIQNKAKWGQKSSFMCLEIFNRRRIFDWNGNIKANTLASVKMMEKLRKKILAKDNVPEKRDALSDWMRTIGRYQSLRKEKFLPLKVNSA